MEKNSRVSLHDALFKLNAQRAVIWPCWLFGVRSPLVLYPMNAERVHAPFRTTPIPHCLFAVRHDLVGGSRPLKPALRLLTLYRLQIDEIRDAHLSPVEDFHTDVAFNNSNESTFWGASTRNWGAPTTQRCEVLRSDRKPCPFLQRRVAKVATTDS
jgi:hypothetical protein